MSLLSRQGHVIAALDLFLTCAGPVLATDTFATIGCAAESAALGPADKGALCGSEAGGFAFAQVQWPEMNPAFTWSMNNDQYDGYEVAKALRGANGRKVACPATCGTVAVSTADTTCYYWARGDTKVGLHDKVEHTAQFAVIGSVANTGGDQAKSVLCSATCTGYSVLWC